MKNIRKFLSFFFILAIPMAGISYYAIWGHNIRSEIDSEYLHIPRNTTFEGLVDILDRQHALKSLETFKVVAQLMKYNEGKIRSGRFQIRPGWSNRKLIQHLRSGSQAPVMVTINNVRILEDLGPEFALKLDIDSLSFNDTITDPDFISSYGYRRENFLAMFLPNTYEMYWNSTIGDCVDRMQSENAKYWSGSSRVRQLESLGLSTAELYTLASIVEKESNASHEKSRIAGVYLNRLKSGIRLQADPTVVFATGEFGLRRVLKRHLETDSPYNTYLYAGLPPGPICMPSLATIEATLNAEDHKYLFFCAKPGYGSEHAFAETLAEHTQNARKYRAWLQSENIR